VSEAEPSSAERSAWVWVALAAGAALGAVGVMYLFHHWSPGQRMGRLLLRCEDRIRNIEGTLADLHATIATTR